MIHLLKTDPVPFQLVLDKFKTFELRKDDRDFSVGDTLVLKETTHSGEEIAKGSPLEFTGRTVRVYVIHIMRGPLRTGKWVLYNVSVAAYRAALSLKTALGCTIRVSLTTRSTGPVVTLPVEIVRPNAVFSISPISWCSP